MRQIEVVTFSAAKMFLNEGRPVYEITDAYLHADAVHLHELLMNLIADSKIIEADLLIESIDTFDSNYFHLF